MNIILFEDHSRSAMLPFTFTRPVAEIRVGILTIREKWEKYLDKKVSHLSQEYLREKFPLKISDDNLLINGKLLPDTKLAEQILKLKMDEKLLSGNDVVAMRIGKRVLKYASTPDEMSPEKAVA